MSRDQQSDDSPGPSDPADEPTTGPPAGAVSATSLGPSTNLGPSSLGPTTGPRTTGAAGAPSGPGRTYPTDSPDAANDPDAAGGQASGSIAASRPGDRQTASAGVSTGSRRAPW